MKVYDIDIFKGGWFIGNFIPTILKTGDIEIALHRIKKGHISDSHFHKKSIEANVIVEGKIKNRDNNEILKQNHIFIFNKEEKTNLEFLEDTILIVIKWPSVPGDKYY